MEKAISSIPGLGEIDGGVVERLLQLERHVLYRSYYFPGGLPKKYVSGVGTDTSTVHYDGHKEERDLFSNYNPRYLDEYIEQARQYGFHKHFIVYYDDQIRSMSFAEACNILSMISPESSPKRYYNILAGLAFMDKLRAFVQDCKGVYNTTVKLLERDLKYGDKIVTYAYKQISNTIGQSRREFINNDAGWLATDEKFCFASDIFEKWRSAQEEYNEYKRKLWDALANIESLNLCTNNISGIMIGNVTLEQTATCIQKINDNLEETTVKTSKDGGSDNVVVAYEDPSKAIRENVKGSKDSNKESSKVSNQQSVNRDPVILSKVLNRSAEGIYMVLLSNGRKTYMDSSTHRLKDTNELVQFSLDQLQDNNGVPYYLFDSIFSTNPPSKVREIIKTLEDNTVLTKLDNNTYAYVKSGLVVDAFGYNNGYESIDKSIMKNYKPPSKEHKTSLAVIITVTLIVLLLLGSFGYFYYLSKNNVSESSEELTNINKEIDIDKEIIKE